MLIASKSSERLRINPLVWREPIGIVVARHFLNQFWKELRDVEKDEKILGCLAASTGQNLSEFAVQKASPAQKPARGCSKNVYCHVQREERRRNNVIGK